MYKTNNSINLINIIGIFIQITTSMLLTLSLTAYGIQTVSVNGTMYDNYECITSQVKNLSFITFSINFDTNFTQLPYLINASAKLTTTAFVLYPNGSSVPTNGSQGASQIINKLKQVNALTNQTLYIAFTEECQTFWGTQKCTCSTKSQWLQQFLSEATQIMGLANVGIFTWETAWGDCDGTSGDEQYQLWYQGTDSATFSDFMSFGGWTQPTMKQEADLKNVICNMDYEQFEELYFLEISQ